MLTRSVIRRKMRLSMPIYISPKLRAKLKKVSYTRFIETSDAYFFPHI